jgi:hypothetical protein
MNHKKDTPFMAEDLHIIQGDKKTQIRNINTSNSRITHWRKQLSG